MKFCQFCGTALNDGEICTCDGARGERAAAGQQRPPSASAGSPGRPLVKRREIVTQIILSIITCGIYSFFWMYCILSDIYNLLEEQNKAGMDILLSIVTCGLYTIYLYYKLGSKIQQVRIKYNLVPKDDSIIFVVLAIFGMSIVADIIIQVMLNNEIATL